MLPAAVCFLLVLHCTQGRVDVLAFIPDQAQAGADGKSASDGAPQPRVRMLLV